MSLTCKHELNMAAPRVGYVTNEYILKCFKGLETLTQGIKTMTKGVKAMGKNIKEMAEGIRAIAIGIKAMEHQAIANREVLGLQI